MDITSTSESSCDHTDIENDWGITVEVHRDFESLESIRQEWDDFMQSQHVEIFLSFQWCRIWWNYYGRNRTPVILIARSQNEICGILPLFGERVRLGLIGVSVLKLFCTDFMPVSVSIPVKHELLSSVLKLSLREILRSFSFDILHIGPISGGYPSYVLLKSALEQHSQGAFEIRTKTTDVQTYFEIRGDWDSQIAPLSKDERRNLRRTYKAIDEAGQPFEAVFTTTNEFYRSFEDFVKLHQIQWQQQGKAGHFVAWPFAYEFHRDVAADAVRENRLRLLSLRLGNQCIGYNYGFRYGSTYYSYLGARGDNFDNPRIVYYRIAFFEQMKKAMDEGVVLIDSMRGNYEHKLALGGTQVPVENIFMVNRSGLSSFRAKSLRLFATALNVCYSKVWRARIAPALGIRPGRFLAIWVRTHGLSL